MPLYLYHLRDNLPIRTHYPHRIYPFTGFTFFNQTPHSSIMPNEGKFRFSKYRVYRPYARCSPPVCLRFTNRMHGTWKTFAPEPQKGTTIHPILPMNKAIKRKSEVDEGGKKDATSFHARRKFTKVLLILVNTVTTYFVQLLPGSQVQKEHSDQY